MARQRPPCECPQAQPSSPEHTTFTEASSTAENGCPYQGEWQSEPRTLLAKQEVISQDTPTDDSHARDTETFATTVLH